MALFGRRKPGFAKEVAMNPEEIPGEFSDALDPAINKSLDNPKLDKMAMEEKAAQVLSGQAETAAEASADSAAKPDLLDYLESLPEVEDPFPPSAEEEPPVENVVEKTPCQVLADFIRKRSAGAQITPKALLSQEEENLDELLTAMAADEACKDIRTVKGEKDVYYYSEDNMANNYAMIAMLVEEKDICRTIAQMVRFNCKTYPTPTPLYYFERHPYYLTKVQIKQAMAMMKNKPEYADILLLETANDHVPYLYAEGIMSKKYAQALANGAESREADE